eukprot:TRINITY_DN4067_c0_g1_i3.p1 TRINITY_DN4067_c0_g1~~TRINITY_DN4067_c0_g1_i3.p1  ORF type:complete len:107 (-),score=4.30 TRINITY_DN4067_c0_g1_i3:553-831(-)
MKLSQSTPLLPLLTSHITFPPFNFSFRNTPTLAMQPFPLYIAPHMVTIPFKSVISPTSQYSLTQKKPLFFPLKKVGFTLQDILWPNDLRDHS